MLNIVTLLLESVPCCQMYLFHHVRCIGVSSDSMLLKTYRETKKKCMTSWQDKSLLVCVWSSLSACPLVFSLSIFSPHIQTLCAAKLGQRLSLSFLLWSTDPLKPNKRTKEVASVVFKRFCSCSFLLLFLNQLRGLWRLLRGDHIHCLDVLEILWGVPKLVPK